LRRPGSPSLRGAPAATTATTATATAKAAAAAARQRHAATEVEALAVREANHEHRLAVRREEHLASALKLAVSCAPPS